MAGGSHFPGEIKGVGPSSYESQTPPTLNMQAIPESTVAKTVATLLPIGTLPNDFAWMPIVREAFCNLQRWVRDGLPPPKGEPISLDAQGVIRRDSLGNAIGGVRMPALDAPLQTYQGALSEGGMGSVTGWRKPLAAYVAQQMYPSLSDYKAQFELATDRFLEGRWISTHDADCLKMAAASDYKQFDEGCFN